MGNPDRPDFWLNGTRWGPDRPSFPLLQAEKVLSLPFDLRLNTDYTYRLDGLDTVDGRPSYVVAFDPVDAMRALYRGKVWIDQERFVKLRVQAVQRGPAGPVVSNAETQIFEEVASVGGQPLYLASRVSDQQILLIAGRNLLVEREIRFSDFRVDSDDFVEARATARASNRVMYRETDEGVRYFVKRGVERVVSDELTMSAKAMAMGVTIDPSFEFPLPIVGINYLDFDFLTDDTQLALLFGGVLALGNIQTPTLWGTPFDASLDFFGLAVPTNDQLFDAAGERLAERLLSIPMSVGANVGYQFTDFQKISGGYQVGYDIYFGDELTDADFTPPADTTTSGLGLTYEMTRGGYSFQASAETFHRAGWARWGYTDGEFDPAQSSYRRYAVSLSKDFRVGGFQTFHLNSAWYGGERLDRFSKYRFGLFDATRMHGVPSAGIRFAELAMLRGSYSFSIFDQYRLDLFLDQAFGCDPCRPDRVWQPITGTGVAVNLRAPGGTILRADVGKSFLPYALSGSGSAVVQLMLLKPL